MLSKHFFYFKNTQLHYAKKGSGSKILLTFHGFGQDYKAFDPVIDQLTDEYTVYSFDLFYHGKSNWSNNEKALSKTFWHQLIEAFTSQHHITNFSILCFSMGGKFALSTIESMPHHIDQVVMMAPDGIKTSMWYSLATYPLFFQKLFKSMIVKPNRFFNIIKMLNKLKLVDKGILKFAKSQMNTVKKRRRVYYSWIIFKDLHFDLSEIANRINQHQVKTLMVLGKYDKIITRQGMNRLLDKVPDSRLLIITSGHNDLIKNASRSSDFMSAF